MLISFVIFGQILHRLLHGESSNTVGALGPDGTRQRECMNCLYVKADGCVKAAGRIHNRTYPDVSLSVAFENSSTGGFDVSVETSTGLHTNWLLALVGPVPLMAGVGRGWGLMFAMY